MTQQPEVRIEIRGGPFDAEFITVPLDSDGQPPQFPTTQALGVTDVRGGLTSGPIADVVSQLYELDTEIDATGARWVYRFTGEVGMRPAA